MQDFETAASEFESRVLGRPECLLLSSAPVASAISLLTKTYKSSRAVCCDAPGSSKSTISGSLPYLLTDGFDCEQIWQQIQLLNSDALGRLLRRTKRVARSLEKNGNVKLLAGSKEKAKKVRGEESEDEFDWPEGFENLEEVRAEAGFEDSEEEEGGDDEEAAGSRRKSKKKRSAVDDEFFNLDDMETFLQGEDTKFESGKAILNEEMMEMLFGEDDTDDREDYKYEEFFGARTQDAPGGNDAKRVRFSAEVEEGEEMEDEEDCEGDEYNEDREDATTAEAVSSSALTKFELDQQKLRSEIESLEESNLQSRSWQYQGEVTARARPEQSLLEEAMQFDHSAKAAPVITEEVTQKLEDVIIQRIKDKAWDDVERKVKPKGDLKKYRNELVLDQHKSKQSLSQIYEQEFVRKNEKAKEDETNPEHDLIRSRMKDLFYKLDILSNHRFSAREPIPEVKVVNNMPSIAMEDVAPVASSEAAVLAPEEIRTRAVSAPKGDRELTEHDRKRARRLKKGVVKAKVARRAQREGGVPRDKLKQLGKVAKVRLADKKTKTSTEDSVPVGKNMKSANFFATLSNQVAAEIAEKTTKTSKVKVPFAGGKAAQFKM